jgi:hypothetical protein
MKHILQATIFYHRMVAEDRSDTADLKFVT